MDTYFEQPKKLIRRGIFRCAHRFEAPLVILTGILAVICLFSFMMLISAETAEDMPYGEIIDIFFIIFEFVFACLFTLALYGKPYKYYAEENEFIVISPSGKKQIFYYSDVYDVKYEHLTLIGVHRGYLVTITDSIKETSYRYIVGENKVFTGTASTPFYYLEVNCGLRSIEREQIDASGITAVLNDVYAEKHGTVSENYYDPSTERWWKR